VETPARDRRVTNLPADLDVERARLPATYIAAKHALAECSRLDVCKDWADKAQALASYARQANDDALQKLARSIQARAIRRCGELLQQIEPGQGARNGKRQEGTLPPLTRSQVANEAGLSEHQRKTALRVASVSVEEFETAVEVDRATVTELADRGKGRRPPVLDHLGGRDPEDFHHATKLLGAVAALNREVVEIDLVAALRGLWPNEAEKLNTDLEIARAWLAQIEFGGSHGV
jgi:hypothetical protein